MTLKPKAAQLLAIGTTMARLQKLFQSFVSRG